MKVYYIDNKNQEEIYMSFITTSMLEHVYSTEQEARVELDKCSYYGDNYVVMSFNLETKEAIQL